MNDFLRAHRSQIIFRTMGALTKVADLPQSTAVELEKEISLFMEDLVESLVSSKRPSKQLSQGAARQGRHMHHMGVPLAQVVHVYGDICQATTELAAEMKVSISPADYHTFNACLDQAIAEAVSAYARETERGDSGQERIGFLAHELRNAVGTALLAFDVLQRGQVGINGSTGAVLHRSLTNLRDLIERELTIVRIERGSKDQQQVGLAEFIHEVTSATAVQAQARNIRLVVMQVDPGLTIRADRQLLISALTNLLQNALKFSHAHGEVSLRAYATADRVRIEVADACGGLPTDKIEELFRPYEQQSADRTGLGLGLTISRRAVQASGGEITVRNLPGKGCIFTIELPF